MKTMAMFIAVMFAGLTQALDSKIMSAIAHVETRNRTGIVGDLHMKEHAYGKYQIRRIYMKDVMSTHRSEFQKLFHMVNPTLRDIQWNDAMGKWFVEKYISKYGANYTKITGKPLTPEIAFQIHNGGPMGWKKGLKVYRKSKIYAFNAMKYYKTIA